MPEAITPDMSIKANRPPIRPPFNLSKFDLIKSIDKKTIVALREEIFKKVNGQKGFNNIIFGRIRFGPILKIILKKMKTLNLNH